MTEENKEKDTVEEPSIEEILSSIRDIISDEDEDDGKDSADNAEKNDEPKGDSETNEAPSMETPTINTTVAADADDDALDLSQFVETPTEDGAEAEEKLAEDASDEGEAEPESDMSEDDENPLDGIDFDHPAEDELDMVDAEGEISTEDVQDDSSDDGVGGILNEGKDPLVDAVAETATVGALAKLAENIALARTKDGVTLEDIVRELLRPMLKDWLDENLPIMIERLVSQELERLTEKAMRK